MLGEPQRSESGSLCLLVKTVFDLFFYANFGFDLPPGESPYKSIILLHAFGFRKVHWGRSEHDWTVFRKPVRFDILQII